MNIDAVILQLKTYAPIFNGNVAGLAQYELAKDQIWLPPPAAYVMPLDDEATPNKNLAGLNQIVTETVAIIVDLDNSADRRGQAASTDALLPIRTAVFAAILNWRPDGENAARGFAYARGGLISSDRARMRWQFDFAIENTITSDDGFQLPSEPLTDIVGTITDERTGETLAVFDAKPCQPAPGESALDECLPFGATPPFP